CRRLRKPPPPAVGSSRPAPAVPRTSSPPATRAGSWLRVLVLVFADRVGPYHRAGWQARGGRGAGELLGRLGHRLVVAVGLHDQPRAILARPDAARHAAARGDRVGQLDHLLTGHHLAGLGPDLHVPSPRAL